MIILGSPTSPFLLGQNPPALRPKSPGEVGMLEEPILEAQVNGRSFHELTVLSYDNYCDRLIAQTCRSISWRLPSLVARAYKWPRQE